MLKASGIRHKHRLLALGAATFLTPLAPAVAMAQDSASPVAVAQVQPAPPSDASAPTGSIGEVVVTATRRSESVQRVALSVQALSSQKLDDRQISNFADYTSLLPSVSFSTLGPGRSEVFFRGISVNGGILPTSAVYLDEIPITQPGGMPEVHTYDMARVEALSGPQGTLFGSSSLAGTLRLITNKPELDKWSGGYDIQADKYGAGNPGGQFEGFTNIPVAPNVAVRLMGFYEAEGGYIDNKFGSYTFTNGQTNPALFYPINNASEVKNDYNPVVEYGGRASVLVQAAENWTVTPSVTYQALDTRGTFNYDPRVGNLTVHDFQPTRHTDDWYQASLTIQGQIANFDITSSTGYFDRQTRTANDYAYYAIDYDKMGGSYYFFRHPDGSVVDPNQYYTGDTHDTKITQELRVSVPKQWPFALTAGVFYQYQLNKNDGNYLEPGVNGSYVGDTFGTPKQSLAPIVRGDALYIIEENQTFHDLGFYSEGSYNILPDLKLTAGVRYFQVNNNTYGFNGVGEQALKAGCTLPFPATRLSCSNVNEPYSQDGETHKASLAWQFTPTKMAYVTYSTGFRPGGGNNLAGSHPYQADTLTNYELGFKTTWGGVFRWNAAIYYEQWDGIQYSVIPPGVFGSGVTVNAGNARVYGVESDFDWKINHLTFSGSGSYNDAALSTNFCDLVSSTDLQTRSSCSTSADIAAVAGTRLPRQPKFKGQVSARYDWTVKQYDTFVQAVMSGQTDTTSDLNTYLDSLYGNTDGFMSFDFSAGFKHDNWKVQAFLQNAFDERGVLSKNTFCEIQTCYEASRNYPIKPRYFGVKFGQTF